MSYKRASIGLMTLLTALLCFLAILLSTPWGAQLTFFIVKGVSPIQAEYKSGALLKDLTLKELTINNDNLVMKAKDINLQLHLRCLWKNQLCIDELSIAALHVSIKEGQLVVPETLEEQPLNFSNITLPFNIKMKKFTLAKAQIKSQGVEVKLTDFSSALSVSKNVLNTIAINIEKSTLASAHLNLLVADASAKTPTATTGNPSIEPSTWALASVPTLYSPFKLTIKSFDVKKVTVNEVKKTGDKNSLLSIDNAVARLSWFKTQLSIEQLSSKVNTVGELSLKGKVDFIPPYKIDLTLNSAIEEFELLPQLNHSTQQVLLHGNLSQLETNLNSEGELAFIADMTINVTDANLPYSLSADISQYILPNEITEFITPSTLLFKSQGDINSHVVELKSKVTGYGYHDATLELNAMYSEQIFKIKTLHFEELNSNNNLTMTGELALGDRLLWDVNVNSSGITLPNIDKRLSGRVQGNVNSKGFWQDKEWAFSVLNSTLTGEVNNIKLNAKANVDINHKGQLTPSELKVDYGDIALHLKGYSDQNWHVEGMANINSTSLWLKDFESNLSTKIAINGPILQPEINLQGEIKKLLMANLFSDSISFDAKYQPLNNHQHQINLVSPLINMGEHSIHNVSLASVGDLNQQKTSLAWQGDSSLNLLLNSQYFPEKRQWKVETQQPTFAIEDHVFTSNQPITLVYHKADKKLAINKHCWQEANSQLCIKEDITVSLDQGELALTIKLNTELIKPFIPSNLHLDNSFDGDIVINWQPDMSPSVDAKLLISAGDIKIDDEDNQQKIVEWQSGLLNLKIIKDSVNGGIALFSHNIIKDTVDSRSELITMSAENTSVKRATDNPAEILSAKFSVLLANNRIVDSHIRLNDYSLSPLKSLFPELTLLKGIINTQLTLNG
ncbi:MAG: hypothetical protein P8I03_00385, partial [Thalassotalea sp.]|nr:hypothetical protein [Thalassotalea sp.]